MSTDLFIKLGCDYSNALCNSNPNMDAFSVFSFTLLFSDYPLPYFSVFYLSFGFIYLFCETDLSFCGETVLFLPVFKTMSSEENKTDSFVESKYLEKNEFKQTIHNSLTHLSSFKLKDILQNSTNRKAVFLRGAFDSKEGDAIVILEKTAFSEENLLNGSEEYFPGNNHLEQIFQNDIYGDYKFVTDSELNSK